MRHFAFRLLGPALMPAFLPALAGAQTTASALNPAASYVAGALANDARDALRDPNLPPAAAAAQASVLLQFAAKLDPSDLPTLHLLAQAASAAGDVPARRAALRQIIGADPGDLVSQVQYIDLLADDAQKAEDRVAVYQGMLAQTDLDAQVRSEIALRLARLAEARGDAAGCRDTLAQAVKLNDLNVAALRDLACRAAAESGPDTLANHIKALVALLNANPYQPGAWFAAAQVAQSAGVHDRAAEFLDTAADQARLEGVAPAGDLYLDLAMELAIAGQSAKARALATNLANLPDAPLMALMVDELFAQHHLPVSASTAVSQPASRLPEIRRHLAELAKDAQNPSALADAAGADLTILPTPGPDTPAWIDSYAKLVAADDPTLVRLKGWLLFRQGNFDEAQKLLEKTTDPLAQLGRARVLLATHHSAQAFSILQDLWNANPTGLLALQIVLTTDHPDLTILRLTLADSAKAKVVRPLMARLTPALANIHRQPGNAQVVAASFRKAAVGPGEPVLLQIRLTNALDRAVPVGPDGMIKTSIGLAAVAQRVPPTGSTVPAGPTTALGLYALEDVQRVFRLEPHRIIETTLRVDQGRLADVIDQNPGATYAGAITLLVAPGLISPTEFTAGLGGQAIAAGEFQHAGLALANAADYQRLAQDLTALTGERQMVRITAAATLTAVTKGDPLSPLVTRLVEALATLAGAQDPLVKTALLRALPVTLPDDLERSIGRLATDPDPLVRVLWARHQTQIALHGTATVAGTAEASKADRPGALAALEKLSTYEKDPLVSEYLSATLPLLRTSATKPQ